MGIALRRSAEDADFNRITVGDIDRRITATVIRDVGSLILSVCTERGTGAAVDPTRKSWDRSPRVKLGEPTTGEANELGAEKSRNYDDFLDGLVSFGLGFTELGSAALEMSEIADKYTRRSKQ